jgi:hypothetical protein
MSTPVVDQDVHHLDGDAAPAEGLGRDGADPLPIVARSGLLVRRARALGLTRRFARDGLPLAIG